MRPFVPNPRDPELDKEWAPQFASLINHMGDDLTVVNAARVSFGKKKEALGYTGAEGGAMRPI